jgi:hypothetical protein
MEMEKFKAPVLLYSYQSDLFSGFSDFGLDFQLVGMHLGICREFTVSLL